MCDHVSWATRTVESESARCVGLVNMKCAAAPERTVASATPWATRAGSARYNAVEARHQAPAHFVDNPVIGREIVLTGEPERSTIPMRGRTGGFGVMW